MAPYLPRNGASGSPYSEGGALYALGLTYALAGAPDMRAFLLQSLRDTPHEARLNRPLPSSLPQIMQIPQEMAMTCNNACCQLASLL
jgi:hypothetical protein